MCRVAIDTHRAHGGDTFRARFIGPAIVGASVRDLCGGKYEASAVLLDGGRYEFELFFEALSYAGHMGSTRPNRGHCINQPMHCSPVRLGNSTHQMTFVDYIAWHDRAHGEVLGKRVALLALPEPIAFPGRACAAFSEHTCSAADSLPGRWVKRAACLRADPPCAVGATNLLAAVGAEFVWAPYSCVLRIFSAEQAMPLSPLSVPDAALLSASLSACSLVLRLLRAGRAVHARADTGRRRPLDAT